MMAAANLDAVHIANLGNLSWLLCGADLLVSFADAPVAEAVVTQTAVTVVASNIERGRLSAEELPNGVNIVYASWFEPDDLGRIIKELTASDKVLSDTAGRGWPSRDFWPLRVPLTVGELRRYRELGQDAAMVFTDVLSGQKAGVSEHEVAANLAEALRAKGMQPVVLLVGSDERLMRFKHPLPQKKKVEKRLMAVACARRHGLYANLTRLLGFEPEPKALRRAYDELLEIEAVMLEHSRHGILVKDWFAQVQEVYAASGHQDAWRDHHQGGPTGYYTRDFVARPDSERMLVDGSAYAWNPSLAGLKVEDTVVLINDRLEILSEDPRWPLRVFAGRHRPEVLSL